VPTPMKLMLTSNTGMDEQMHWFDLFQFSSSGASSFAFEATNVAFLDRDEIELQDHATFRTKSHASMALGK
jgi:hypothetical protein